LLRLGVTLSSCGNDFALSGGSESGQVDPLTGINEVHAVVWHYGEIKDLGTFGGSHSAAQAVNDGGQLTGFAMNDIPDPYSHAFLPIPRDENHLDVDGCDYSMVDVPAQPTQPGVRTTVKPTGPTWRWLRSPWFHLPSLGLATGRGDAL